MASDAPTTAQRRDLHFDFVYNGRKIFDFTERDAGQDHTCMTTMTLKSSSQPATEPLQAPEPVTQDSNPLETVGALNSGSQTDNNGIGGPAGAVIIGERIAKIENSSEGVLFTSESVALDAGTVESAVEFARIDNILDFPSLEVAKRDDDDASAISTVAASNSEASLVASIPNVFKVENIVVSY